MTSEVTPADLPGLLVPIAEARKGADSRLQTWEAVSKNVHGYLTSVSRAVKDAAVVEAPLHMQRGSAPGHEVVLRFATERVPMRGRHGDQSGASLHFVPTLSGLITVRVVGSWIGFDQRLVGPEPVEEVLGRFEPEALSVEGAVRELVARFFAIAVKTHWTQSQTIEV